MTRSERHSRKARYSRDTARPFSFLSTFIITLLVLINVAACVPLLLGYSYNIVMSNSMSPTIYKDALVVIKHLNPQELKEGDVALYSTRIEAQNVMVLHRIQSVEQSADNGLLFHTKGDANAKADVKPITSNQIQGKYVAHIPYIGFVAHWIRDNSFLLLIGLGAIMLSKLISDAGRRKRKPRTVPVS